MLVERKGCVKDSEKQEFLNELKSIDHMQKLTKEGHFRGKSMRNIEISKLLQCLRNQRCQKEIDLGLEIPESSVKDNSGAILQANRNSFETVSKNRSSLMIEFANS